MRSVTVRTADLKNIIINLGFVGENEHRQIRFDAKKDFEEYPHASASLTVVPPEGESYPAIIERDGDYVLWTITDSDVIGEGDGEIQLAFTEGEVVKRTCIARTKTDRSLVPTGSIPSGIDDFITRAGAALTAIPETINAALAEAKASGEFDGPAGPAGQDGTDGQDGFSPIATVSKTGSVATITITDKNGTTTAQISDGEGGGTGDYADLTNKPQIGGVTLTGNMSLHDLGAAAESDIPDPTSIIDDTAGSGDTNKVWSADKSHELLTEIVNKAEIKDSSETGADLDISDDDGNVLVRMKNGHITTKYFNSAKYGAKIITLKADGSGDYATLREALDAITDADPDTNPYEIHLKPGTYDTLAGFTEEEIQSADIGGGYTDQSMVGAKTKNGVSIIGDGDRESVILTAELDTSDYSVGVRGNISTLNLKGTGRIENLTIKARNLRYCVHDDFDFSERYTRIVKNCCFIPLGNSMSYNPATSYGSGIRIAGCDALFENCDFTYKFGMHTKAGMTGCSIVVLNHCTGLSMRIGDVAAENDTAHHTFIVNGCDFEAISITRQTATTPHVFIIGVDNPNTMDLGLTEDMPMFANLIKTKLSSLPVGTFVNVGTGELTVTSGGINAVKAANADSALGVIVYKDSNYDYIQKEGFVRGDRIGLSSLAVGDYVTLDSDMVMTATGATASNAVGVVKYTDSSDRSQIWLM